MTNITPAPFADDCTHLLYYMSVGGNRCAARLKFTNHLKGKNMMTNNLHWDHIPPERCCDMCTKSATVRLGNSAYCLEHYDMVTRSMEEQHEQKPEPKRLRKRK